MLKWYNTSIMSKIPVAVIGVGHLGSIHARIYSQLPGVSLVGVYDIDSERAETIAKKYKTKAFTNHKKLLAQVKAVSIAVPTVVHHEMAKDCLQKGVHVLIEKPITKTLAQADSLLKLAKKHKALLQVGHVERFNSAFQGIVEICKKPRFIECHRLGPYSQRGTDVGVVLDLMIHDIDIVLWLTQSPVKKIEAIGVKVISSTEDMANARITFKNGAVVDLTASRVTPDAQRKIRLFQHNTYISVDYVAQAVKMYQLKGTRIVHNELPIEREEPLKAQLSAFLTAVRQGKRPLVTGEDAREALRVALTITRKIQQNLV